MVKQSFFVLDETKLGYTGSTSTSVSFYKIYMPFGNYLLIKIRCNFDYIKFKKYSTDYINPVIDRPL